MTWQFRRITRRAGVTAMLVGFLLLVSSITVSAHSYFMVSDPVDGAILAHAPSRVILLFSSAVSPTFTTVQLVEAGGAHYTPSTILSYGGHKNILEVDLPAIPNGSYRLSFSTRDAVDLHLTAGSIAFGVGMAPPATIAIPTPQPPSPSEVVLRWVALAGLSALLGGVAVALLVVGRLPVEPGVRARIQRSLLGLALVGNGLVLAGESGLLGVQASSLGPTVPTTEQLLSGSEYGTRWWVILIVVAGLMPLLAALWLKSRSAELPGLVDVTRRQKVWSLLTNQVRVVLLTLALTVAMALSGHVAGTTGTSIGGISLLATHIGAMGVWAGGLVALTLAVLTLRRALGRTDRIVVLALAVGFGPLAAVSFGLLGVTGLLLSGMQVASLTALLSTQYGIVLLAKVGLIGIVALVGLRHALWTWRGLARAGVPLGRLPARLPLTIALETTGALAVVALAAVLGASAPAIGPQFAPPQTGTAVTQLTKAQDGMLITLSVKPNRSGPNLVSARVVYTRWPAPAPVERVNILVRQPSDPAGQINSTTATGPSYDAGSIKLGAGDASFTVTVIRKDLGATSVTLPWHVNALEVVRAPVVVSNQPLAPVVDIAAVLVLLLAAAVVGAGLVRYRRAEQAARALARGRRASLVAMHRYASAPVPPSRRRPGLDLHARGRVWLRRGARLK